MKCPICYEYKKKWVRCSKCYKKLCLACAMKFIDRFYCGECYTDIFAKELIFDLADVFGIKERIEQKERELEIKVNVFPKGIIPIKQEAIKNEKLI